MSMHSYTIIRVRGNLRFITRIRIARICVPPLFIHGQRLTHAPYH